MPTSEALGRHRSLVSFGIVKRVNQRLWLLLACILAAGLALLWGWGAAIGRTPEPKTWLVISRPLVRSATNSGVPAATITFVVSNVGPRAVDFRVAWFECRSRSDRGLLATNRMRGAWFALDSGRFTNLVLDVAARPLEDHSCGCMADWIARRVVWRELLDRAATRAVGPEGVDGLPWQPGKYQLVSETAFAANVDLSDYFRLVYGWTREKWLEEVSQAPSPTSYARRSGPSRLPGSPTLEETVATDARQAFVAFCQNPTDSTRTAEPIAPPKTASLHR